MGLILVIAGNHSEYVRWMRQQSQHSTLAYGGVLRDVSSENDLLGVRAEDVSGVVLAGRYTENRAWESDSYRRLMDEAAEMGLPWARTPVEDWEKATAEPVSTEQMSETRAELERLERELEED